MTLAQCCMQHLGETGDTHCQEERLRVFGKADDAGPSTVLHIQNGQVLASRKVRLALSGKADDAGPSTVLHMQCGQALTGRKGAWLCLAKLTMLAPPRCWPASMV